MIMQLERHYPFAFITSQYALVTGDTIARLRPKISVQCLLNAAMAHCSAAGTPNFSRLSRHRDDDLRRWFHCHIDGLESLQQRSFHHAHTWPACIQEPAPLGRLPPTLAPA